MEREALRLELAHDGIGRSAERVLERLDSQLDAWSIRLSDLDPATTMARGWSITRGADGKAVRSAADVAAGDTLRTTLVDGELRSTVVDVQTGDQQ